MRDHYIGDPTDAARHAMVVEENAKTDEQVKAEAGEQTWDTVQLQVDFEVIGFAAPFCIVRRRSDGVRGSIKFRHSPRVYYGFEPDA